MLVQESGREKFSAALRSTGTKPYSEPARIPPVIGSEIDPVLLAGIATAGIVKLAVRIRERILFVGLTLLDVQW